jgi:hypothetical protein
MKVIGGILSLLVAAALLVWSISDSFHVCAVRSCTR